MKLFPLFILSVLILSMGCAQQSQIPTNQTTPTNPPIVTYPPTNTTSNSPSSPATTNTAPTTTPGPSSQDFTYASDAWTIYGTDYTSQANSPTTAIILLPGLGQNRSSYPVSFIQLLHDDFPNAEVISIDMRGQGQSTNLGSWQNFDTNAFIGMKTDVLDLDTKYIGPTHPSITDYYVIGASMGSTAGMLAAPQDKKITKLAMLSPGTDFNGVDITKILPNYPHALFLAASSGDSYSVQSVSQLASIADPNQISQKIYDGSAHGTDMFASTTVSGDLLNFLKAS